MTCFGAARWSSLRCGAENVPGLRAEGLAVLHHPDLVERVVEQRLVDIEDDGRLIDLDKASTSKAYCQDYLGQLQEVGLVPTEISGHLQGQVLAMHPAYEEAFQPFYPFGLKDKERTAWAAAQLKKIILASVNLGTRSIPVLSGGFAWHMVYPWPQRPQGPVEEAFREMGARWTPILDMAADNGIAIAYELHPGSDLYDGATYEMFLDEVRQHPAACLLYDPSHFVLQQLDYLQFIEFYGERIKSFHVKDAEFRPSGRVGVYSGYQPWAKRAGRFRSLGDGQVDFKRVFTLLTEKNYDGWAVLEWECCVKSSDQGAKEGAPFIAAQIISATEVAFDDFAGAQTDAARNRRLLGLA
jgi:sugar phosphate isomerase/epimerase